MAHEDRIIAHTLETQQRIFRLANRDYGLTLKAASIDSNIPYATLRTYASGEAMMPVSALVKLCDVVPDHLLSQLFDPVGRHIAANEKLDGDLDELGREAARFNADYVEARSRGNITSTDRAKLTREAAELGATAQKVTA